METTAAKLQAYRRVVEQTGEYWTVERLELRQWDFLYEQMQQYLSLLDMKLNGHPQVQFARRQNRLYIFGDFADGDIKEGDFIVAEVYSEVNDSDLSLIHI